ncbi:MAG TPA: hypothetical protein PLP42_10345 [Acidobacteriota bacterium]|jgi:Tfp pilus assembly pilus retraction ATPase PilT|nr:hypothetical protein [Acidobacteriota bacterium]
MDDVVMIFDRVLAKAREVGASDIHLSTGVMGKYRIHGRMVPITSLNPLTKNQAEAIVRHVITASEDHF